MGVFRLRNGVMRFSPAPGIRSWAAVVGRKEREGPLGWCFSRVQNVDSYSSGSFEAEERNLIQTAFADCIKDQERPDLVFGGDLLNQCVSTAFAMREQEIPYIGLYGACSTMAESLALAALSVASGAAGQAAAVTASHFCTAERQYRLPLNYGGQRPQTAQWTVTGSGAVLMGSRQENEPFADAAVFGRVVDYGVRDACNMGAAMVPAAAETLLHFFSETETSPDDYDRIFTGDLGRVGSQLLQTLMEREGMPLGRGYRDCGVLIFDPETQDTHAGGSGCGCSASVLCGLILPALERGDWQRVLLVATGALLSPTSILQGESIPGIAHLISLRAGCPPPEEPNPRLP